MNGPRGSWARDTGTTFYRSCALAALAVALAGFFLTYVRLMAAGTFDGPSRSHLHGVFVTAWLALVIVQSFVARGRLRLHRRLGWTALALVPMIVVSTALLGAEGARRDIARFGPSGADQVIGTVTTPVAFMVLAGAALLLRNRPQWHKRLIFLATVAILWPAWFRWRHFLPELPRPDIWLGIVLTDAPIILAAARDRLAYGAVHPAYLTAGVALVVQQVAEATLFGTPPWRRVALTLVEVLP